MLDLFHALPDVIILPLVVTMVTLAAMAAPFIGRYGLRLTPSTTRDAAAFDAYKAIMAMVGVVLAFSLVEVNNNLRAAETLVAREASALALVDRTLLRFGAPQADQARALVTAYGQSRVTDEWPGLAQALRNPITEDRYTALSGAVRKIEPQPGRQQAMYSELLKGIDDLAEARELVLQDALTELPLFFWVVTDGFLLLAFALAMMSDTAISRAVGLGATAGGVALLLAFVMIVDRPYRGETSVKPLPLQKTLVLNSRRI